MKPIIQIEGLTKAYQEKEVVRNLHLNIEKGEIFGFLGHNGAGKTTTISMLITLLEPSEGNAWINGFNVMGESMEVRKHIGYLPEQVYLYGDLTVEENLIFLGKLSGIVHPRERALTTLAQLNFSDWRDTKVKQLSKGMRQRVGLAQAILHQPEVLFLDEPSSGLDPQGTLELRDILRKLNRENGTTIFMNTHMLSEVSHLCTGIGILQTGRLIVSGSMEEVLGRFPGETSLENIYLKAMKEGAEA
ncbi:MAG: ABC transporter ATP-binding protein [Spirochaetales bacterium]|nr:ABC transporter ATP-binding protein [Spirochaetales bacterium]